MLFYKRVFLERSRPFYLSHPDKTLWAEYLADSRTVFVRINVIQDSANDEASFEIDIFIHQHNLKLSRVQVSGGLQIVVTGDRSRMEEFIRTFLRGIHNLELFEKP